MSERQYDPLKRVPEIQRLGTAQLSATAKSIIITIPELGHAKGYITLKQLDEIILIDPQTKQTQKPYCVIRRIIEEGVEK